MAGSSVTPRRRRENNYISNIGEQGRKTGLTLPTLPRDEQGFEPATHLFTSPSRSTKSARSTRKSNVTISSSDSMELEQSEAPDVSQALSSRAAKLKRPIPTRSPFRKTHIGATPRRHPSLDPRSSPARFESPLSQRSVSRLLDFSDDNPLPSVEGRDPSPHPRPRPASPSAKQAETDTRRDIYSLSDSPLAATRRPNGTRQIVDLASPQYDPGLADDDYDDHDAGGGSGGDSDGNSPLRDIRNDDDDDDDDNQADDDDDDDQDQTELRHTARETAMPPPPRPQIPLVKRPRGRPSKDSRQSDASQVSRETGPSVSRIPDPPSSETKRGRGRPKKPPRPSDDTPTLPVADRDSPIDPPLDNDDPYPEQDQMPELGHEDDYSDEEDDDERAEAVAEAAAAAEQESEGEAAPPKKKRGRPMKEKDGNARPTTSKSKAGTKKGVARPKSKEVRNGSAPREVRATSVPMQRERQLTPDGDEGATHTRSGRISYKPLAYWKNERLEYDHDGGHGMQSIKQIIRMEDRTPQKRPNKRQGGRKNKRAKSSDDGDVEPDEDEIEEEWEQTAGVILGDVRVWDDRNAQPTEDVIEADIAYAGGRLEAREVQGANFGYAKTLTLPFFGSGVVELPPGGFKRTKNSRKMQMVFFVHYGKVEVQVADNSFVISKGGVWQVPRGNFYSIRNVADQDARIFFAQGCEQPMEPAASQAQPE